MKATTETKCSKCGTTENVKEYTIYFGEELTVCNDCLPVKYTGCATCGTFFDEDRDSKLTMRDENAGDITCIFCHPQKFVDACTNLKELCDTLNLIAEVGADDGNNIDFSDLPTFGGDDPKDTNEVFSWDDTHILIQCSKWELKNREDVQE